MKKLKSKLCGLAALLCVALSVLFAPTKAMAAAEGWPAYYEGVMLQGFWWNSYEATKWTNLESQADELSKYFKLIWIPNSGNCGSTEMNMGYMPKYWFTNHNSSFGREEELISMIQTYKDKGTGFIADVVINHRDGVTNWTDFPDEEWDGQTWHIGLDGICGNDEAKWSSDVPDESKPTGADDTGKNFDGCRDLDHTNANVQNNCKNYLKCLKEKYGYVGARYDMVKGYGGEYNKIYNEYADVEYSVGEYWEDSYDDIAKWIEATGKTSAAFDFPCKYRINEAFRENDMTKLVWKANGDNLQPAGMIHYGYARYAVTFVDNHDTYRDGSKFPDDSHIMAANAFILMSPGTPCVFLRHYLDNKYEIRRLIEARNLVGINNCSKVEVLKSDKDIYMAEVKGSKGSAIVKVGWEDGSCPSADYGDVYTSGKDYCVWIKDYKKPEKALYVFGTIDGHMWDTENPVQMQLVDGKYVADITFIPNEGETDCYFGLSETRGDWDDVNYTRYGAEDEHLFLPNGSEKSMNKGWGNVWKVTPGIHTLTVDLENNTVRIDEAENEPEKTVSVFGSIVDCMWDLDNPVKMDKVDGKYVANITFIPKENESECYFGISVKQENLEDTKTTRYGAEEEHLYLPNGSEGNMIMGWWNVWRVTPGLHTITVDMDNLTVRVDGDDPDPEPEVKTLYIFGNLEGYDWDPKNAIQMQYADGKYFADISFVPSGTNSFCYFSISEKRGDWGEVAPVRYEAQWQNYHLHDGHRASMKSGKTNSWEVARGTHRVIVDLDNMTVRTAEVVDEIYVIGEVNDGGWHPANGVPLKHTSNCIYSGEVKLGKGSEPQSSKRRAEASKAGFSFVKKLGDKWNDNDEGGENPINVDGNRFGPSSDTDIDSAADAQEFYLAENNQPGAFLAAPGTYNMDVDWANKTVKLTDASGEVSLEFPIYDDEEEALEPAVYYNLQGIRIANPEHGTYIEVRGNRARKVSF